MERNYPNPIISLLLANQKRWSTNWLSGGNTGGNTSIVNWQRVHIHWQHFDSMHLLKYRAVDVLGLEALVNASAVDDLQLNILSYPYTSPESFERHEEVTVFKSSGQGCATGRIFARATVISDHHQPHHDDPDDIEKYSGRVLIQYQDQSTYHAQPQRLFPLAPFRHCLLSSNQLNRLNLILCRETKHYRRVASLVTTTQDRVLEIGCDFGQTCAQLKTLLGCTVMGLDKSKTHVDKARDLHPHVNAFVCLDIFHDTDKLRALVVEHRVNKVLLDINGNRLLPAVCRAIGLMMDFHLDLDLVIVKSSALQTHVKNLQSTK